MKEKEIEKRLITGVKNLGGKASKWGSPGNAGVPDRIVILPGKKPVFVELKSESARLTALQEVQISRLRNLGQDVLVLYGWNQVKEFLEGCHKNGV